MKSNLTRYLATVNKLNKKNKRWKKVVSVLIVIAVFCTTYALILPAITLETKTVCGLEEHTHAGTCYTMVPTLTCSPDDFIHKHTDECYGENEKAMCGKSEYILHSHISECYNTENELICTFEETVLHVHTDSCYQKTEVVVDEGHAHSEKCYTDGTLTCTEAEREPIIESSEEKRICGLEELTQHLHQDECYMTDENGQKSLTCKEPIIETHKHSEECYTKSVKTLVCTLQEHEHVDSCYLKCPECDEIDSHDIACPYYEGVILDDTLNAQTFNNTTTPTLNEDTTIENSILTLDKNVSDTTDENGNHTLTLETYATGKSIITQTYQEKPADISLVLDYSESMLLCSNPNCTHQLDSSSGSDLLFGARKNGTSKEEFIIHDYVYTNDIANNNGKYRVDEADVVADGTYYVLYRKYDNERVYAKAHYCQQCTETNNNGYTFWHLSRDMATHNHPFHPGSVATTTVNIGGHPLFLKIPNADFDDICCITRHRIMYESLQSFMEDLVARAKGNDGISGTDDDIDHKIGISIFATTARKLFPLTSILGADGELSDTIKDGLDRYVFSLGTATDQGLEQGVLEFKNLETIDDTRSRLLILLTDGVPTGTTEGGIAGRVNPSLKHTYDAINIYQAKVYTIGTFQGADASNKETITTYYESHFNSNLVTQEQMATVNSFMKLLSSNYPNISSLSEWQNRDVTALTLNQNMSTKQNFYMAASNIDELKNAFAHISEDLNIETIPIALDKTTIVKDVITRYFDITPGSEIVAYTMTYQGNSNTGEMLWQKDENSVSTLTVEEGQTSVGELNIEVEVNENATSTVYVTNFDFGANYVGVDEYTNSSGTTHTPHGKKVVLEIKIKRKPEFIGGNQVDTNTADSGVYLPSGEAVDEFPVPETDVTITPQVVIAPPLNFYLGDEFLEHITVADMQNYMEVYINDVKLDLTDTDNYGFEWENDYVDIDVIFLDQNDNEMPNGFVDVRHDQVYKVKVVVTPLYEGAEQTEMTSNEGLIKVFYPELTFKDAQYYFGEPVPRSDDIEKKSFLADETRWRDAAGTYSDSEGIAMDSTTVPEISMTLTPKISGTTLPSTDVPVQAQINSVGYATNTHSLCYFDWEPCLPECEQNVAFHHSSVDSPEFYLHMLAEVVEFPETGGIGTQWFIFSGLALMFGAVLLLYKNKKAQTQVNK